MPSFQDIVRCCCADCPIAQDEVNARGAPQSCGCTNGLPSSMQKIFAGKTALLIRTSSTARVPVYTRLRELGLRIVMVAPNRAPEFEECVDNWIECDTHDPDALRTEVAFELTRLGIAEPDTIISFDEYGVFPASLLAARYGKRAFPFGPEQIRVTNIKTQFRDWCEEHGICAPRHVSLNDATVRASEAVERRGLRYPVVAKPSPGAGSILAKSCETPEDLDDHVARMWAALKHHRATKHIEALGRKVHIAVEEFICGQEVDLDCIVEHGKVVFCAVSDNFETRPPFFAEVGGLTPSALPPRGHAQLRQLLDDYCAAVGPELHGVLHFEAKYDPATDKAVVIEVNCRMGSAETYTMVKNAFGVDLAEQFVRLALDLPLDRCGLNETPLRHCASVNVYPAHDGILTCAHEPEAHPNLVRCCIHPVPGDALRLPPNGFGCAAWMVATGDTPNEALVNIKRFTDELRICVDHHRDA